jgi:hypothetical protein
MDAGSLASGASAVVDASETVGVHTAASAQNLIGLFAIAVSFIALAISAVFAWRANRISASDPWASLLIERVADQVVSAMEDARLFRQLCLNVYASADRKHEVRAELEKKRQLSSQQLHALTALCPEAADARGKRADLDAIDDSFFDNDTTALAQERGEALIQKYSVASEQYLETLRSLVAHICSRKSHPWLRKKSTANVA